MNNQKTQHFFRNNYKMQTILLVSKLLKQFRYLTIRARWGRFWAICTQFLVALAANLDCPYGYGNRVQWTRVSRMKIESTRLEFLVWFHHNLAACGCKSSKLDSISTKGN